MEGLKEGLRCKLPFIVTLYKKLTAKQWPEKAIVFYTGKHREGLTPQSLKEGASGSHTAVIYLAKEWVKLGRQVTVYSSCGDREGIYDGVEYVNYYKFNWQDSFDTLIIWKTPALLQYPVKASQIWFDWHDVVYPPKVYTKERLEKFDKIFAKSKYQRNLLPEWPDSKFAIATNGVDKGISELFDRPKQPYKLIYASRYYRGLELMLTYGWPIIKEEIPEAELHIYYGFTKRDETPKRAAWKQQMISLMKQPGVFEHGRIAQDQLIREKSTASIHYYGSTYPEVDCISVRESAMVGCVPVTTELAALGEKPYCVKVPGEPESRETQEAVAKKVVELLQNPQELERIRQEFSVSVKAETWENIAPIWMQNQK